MEDPIFDVTIVGAGLSGIALARFYLDVHPDSKIVILEKESEIGGTWSKSRTFDTFWTQSPLRTTSFSDVPLELPEDAPKRYDNFPARYVTQYLEDYVRNHTYANQSLLDRIWLGTEVLSVVRSKDVWELQVRGSTTKHIRCSKLAIASGLTSQPNMPKFPRHPNWKAPVLHHRDFGRQSKTLLSKMSPHKHFTVIGGGKSAVDMTYAAVKADKHVNWIIRNTGEGPGFLLHAAPIGRYNNAAEAMLTQNSTRLNPSGFHSLPPESRSLHQSALGRATLNEGISVADDRAKRWANYRQMSNARPGFEKLEPWTSLFWNSGPPGTMPHDDFWDLVSQRVNVYNGAPSGTTASSIVLDDGQEVLTDVLLAGTGWDTAYSFLTPQQIYYLGLPHDTTKDPAEEVQKWKALTEKVDKEILREYPILANPPLAGQSVDAANILTPARLYQGIAPLNDPSILFLGKEKLPNGFFGAEVQAIWATAYWDGHVSLPPVDEASWSVAYMNTFSRRRYPLRKNDGLNFSKDLIWYIDGLLTEVGLTSHRRGWWADQDEPFFINDLKDCKTEYLSKYGYQHAG